MLYSCTPHSYTSFSLLTLITPPLLLTRSQHYSLTRATQFDNAHSLHSLSQLNFDSPSLLSPLGSLYSLIHALLLYLHTKNTNHYKKRCRFDARPSQRWCRLSPTWSSSASPTTSRWQTRLLTPTAIRSREVLSLCRLGGDQLWRR